MVKMAYNSPHDRVGVCTLGVCQIVGSKLLRVLVLLGVLWNLPSVQAGCTWNGISPDTDGLVTIPASVTSIDVNVSSRLLVSVSPIPFLRCALLLLGTLPSRCAAEQRPSPTQLSL